MLPAISEPLPALTALDDFAGHGWGVALQRLGVHESAVENDAYAVATRTAAGMSTAHSDVRDGLLGVDPTPPHDLYLASPPCQPFSTAGSGAGRRALGEVLAAIDERAYRYPERLAQQLGTDAIDPRIALVLAPLARVYANRPRYVIFEQVPSVAPVWEAAGAVMRLGGYSVWTGVLNAEQFGVPQTRRRAILMARNDGTPVAPPTPTHSKYHQGDPYRLDPAVLPWVSMGEALGLRPGSLVGFPRLDDGRAEPAVIDGVAYRARDLRPADRPAQNLTEKARSWTVFSSSGDPDSTSIDADHDPQVDEVTELVGNQVPRGRQPGDYHARPADLLAQTLSSGARTWNLRRRSPLDDAVLERRQLTVGEAAVLQTYPADFPFAGSRTRQFLQIANAVPPLLAEAIVRAVVA